MERKRIVKWIVASIIAIMVAVGLYLFFTHEHVYHETARIEATCVEDGSIEYACFCRASYTEIIPATGHSYDVIMTQASCTAEGLAVYTCMVCGDCYQEAIAVVAHTYESVSTEPTCTEEGSVVYTCICGDSYTQTIPATGHSYETTVVEANCTTQGTTTYTCACGDTYQEDIIPAWGHSYGDWVITLAATTEYAGSQQRTCATCGYVEVQIIDKIQIDKTALAREVAMQIAASSKTDDELQTIVNATAQVYQYYLNGSHVESGENYNTAYGVFIAGEASCAGTTRALGMVLECLGYSWTHVNENQWTHQWCELVVGGNLIYADAQVGLVGYAPHPFYSLG